MRINSGKFRNKLILLPPKETTRPMMERVKKSMFDTLQFDLENAIVCDLFAGSGALGIEAISRGAKDAVFVELDKTVCGIIKKNLANCGLRSTLLNMDYLQALHQFDRQKRQFDIFLVAPPYATNFGLVAIDFIAKNNLLCGPKIIMFESTTKDMEQHFEELGFDVRTKEYGKEKIIYFLTQN